MAINSLSFCGTRYQEEPIRHSRSTTTSRGSGYSRSRSPYEDSFERTTSTPSRTSSKKKKSGFTPAQRGLALLLATGGVFGGGYIAGRNAEKAEYFDAPYATMINAQQSYEQIAQTSKMPLDILLWANDAKDASEVPEKVIIPSIYDATAKKRAEICDKLFSEKTSDEDKAKLEEELEELKERKAKQDELATVYVSDNKKVLIIPNDYVSCEELKEAFGIKDGVILKYNREELGYTWGVGGPEGRGYRDYTGASVPRDGIEIPLSSIKG